MQNPRTAVISLLSVFERVEDTVDHDGRILAECRSSATVVRAVVPVSLLVVAMLLRHVAVLCNIQRKCPVRAGMPADEAIVTITDSDLTHCSLKNCGLSEVSVKYGVIVAIVLEVKCQARQNVKQRRDMLLSLYSHSCFLYILSSILWFTKQPERRIL